MLQVECLSLVYIGNSLSVDLVNLLLPGLENCFKVVGRVIELRSVTFIGKMHLEVIENAALPGSPNQLAGQAADGARHLHDHAGDLPSAIYELIAGQHLVDRPEIEGRLGVDGLARVEVIGGTLGAEQFLKGEAKTATGHESHQVMGVLELGMVGTEGNIAHQCEFSVKPGPIDSGEGRYLEVVQETLDQLRGVVIGVVAYGGTGLFLVFLNGRLVGFPDPGRPGGGQDQLLWSG